MRRTRKRGAAVVPGLLVSRVPHSQSVTTWSGHAAAGVATLAGLLAYSVLMVVSTGAYCVRVAWADRSLVVTPLLILWRQRSAAVVPMRLTRRVAGGATASLSPYRPALARYLALALLAVLVGWLVAHAP
jgi:hypothetical protein